MKQTQSRRRLALFVSTSVVAMALGTSAFAGMDEARRWSDSEFQPSTLSKDKQLKETHIRISAPPPPSAKPLTPDVHDVVHKNIGRVNT